MILCTIQKTTCFVSTEKTIQCLDKHFDWLKIMRRLNYPMAQVPACSHPTPGDDRLLISGVICFSNPHKYMPTTLIDWNYLLVI